MASAFWVFLFFSFCGYLLEKGFASATDAAKQNRKSFLLLPLCPVYGLSVLFVLLLYRRGVPLLFLLLMPTLTEYILHLYYDRLFGVRYWDYSGLRYQFRGRISLAFSTCWLLLTPPALWLSLRLLPLAERIPAPLTFAVWLLFAADLTLSRLSLLRYHDTERLHIGKFL